MRTELKYAILLAKSLKRDHYHNDDDSWYSCPMHPEYGGECNGCGCECGADDHNKKVDELISVLNKLGDE
jgi:hypothetical protein